MIADFLSASPFKIDCYFNETILSNATGFLYEHKTKIYLVTNYHVASGRHFETDLPLDKKHSAIPNIFEFSLPYLVTSQARPAVGFGEKNRLIIRDDNNEPIWTMHPSHGRSVDIAVFPTNLSPESDILTINKVLRQAGEDTEFALRPSLDAFVLGFPRGLSVGRHLAIWKRATLASEPYMDVNGLPAILVDSATREGMSGSPVFVQQTGLWAPLGAMGPMDTVIGSGRMFLGVYSGRLGNDEFSAQLGIVWKKEALIETIESVID